MLSTDKPQQMVGGLDDVQRGNGDHDVVGSNPATDSEEFKHIIHSPWFQISPGLLFFILVFSTVNRTYTFC